MKQPICYDLYCGLGGWTEAFIEEGYRCIGFDIEAHRYPKMRKVYNDELKTPAGNCSPQLWKDRKIQRLSGAGGNQVLDAMEQSEGWEEYPGELRIRDVRSIHGSELRDAAVIVGSSPCQEFSYRAMPWKRAKALPPPYLGMELFNAQFRIQREACEAAGRHIPMVVENVRGAQKWVGRAPWNYGSFYLWGDVPALMPHTFTAHKVIGYSDPRRNGGKGVHLTSQAENDMGRKVSMNFHEHEKTGKPGRSFQSAAVEELHADRDSQGVKQHGSGHIWYRTGNGALPSSSPRRKLASAMIAKIPRPLALHIARAYKPSELEATA